MQPHPHIDADKWRAHALRCRVWLCEVLLWLAEWFGEHRIGRGFRIALRADLKRAQRGVRGAIVLIALSRMSWAETPGRRTWRPGAVKRTRCSADMRHVGRLVRFRAWSLRGRVLRLQAVIDALDAHVARIAMRLKAGFVQLGPVLIDVTPLGSSQADAAASIADSS